MNGFSWSNTPSLNVQCLDSYFSSDIRLAWANWLITVDFHLNADDSNQYAAYRPEASDNIRLISK